MIRCYSQSIFKKKFHLTQKELNQLEKKGAIEIQQSGFYADSMHHHKIVVIKNRESLQNLLKSEKTISFVAGAFPLDIKRRTNIALTITLDEQDSYSKTRLRKLANRLEFLEECIKRIREKVGLSPIICTLDQSNLTDFDKRILTVLINLERKYMSTTEIAEALLLENPKSSGRVIVYNRLRRIEENSKRLEGLPIVIPSRKKWSMNWEDFEFQLDTN